MCPTKLRRGERERGGIRKLLLNLRNVTLLDHLLKFKLGKRAKTKAKMFISRF
jgi:hypothetical protein